MKLMLSGPSERGPQQEPLGFFCPMWVACIAHSLVVMLAVVLIKRELHNLDGRLSLRNETRKGMEPLAGLAAQAKPYGDSTKVNSRVAGFSGSGCCSHTMLTT